MLLENTASIPQTMTTIPAGGGATVFDLKQDPYDLTPAVDHLVATVQEALASDQKIVLMLGEEHATISEVFFAEALRHGLKKAGIEKPVIAVELPHNLLEMFLPLLPANIIGEEPLQKTRNALTTLKQSDPKAYNNLQTLVCSACKWGATPITRLENLTTWHADTVDIRSIDLVSKMKGPLDYTDPTTRDYITKYAASGDAVDAENIDARSPDGLRLRNIFMAQQINTILSEEQTRVVILKTGKWHLGGNNQKGGDYINSLHGRLTTPDPKMGLHLDPAQTRLISVFPENWGEGFEQTPPPEAQSAMNNPDTILIRGAVEARHNQNHSFCGSFAEEIETLTALFNKNGTGTPSIASKVDYNTALEQNRMTLRQALQDLHA